LGLFVTSRAGPRPPNQNIAFFITFDHQNKSSQKILKNTFFENFSKNLEIFCTGNDLEVERRVKQLLHLEKSQAETNESRGSPDLSPIEIAWSVGIFRQPFAHQNPLQLRSINAL
jgi:hypothetical protein